MKAILSKNNFRQAFPLLFLACWSVLLLANFVPALPQPVVIIGYLWKVEFALALFLLVSLAFLIKSSETIFKQVSKNEFVWIISPLLLFTIWSGISAFWAESVRNAIHHTLLWACYLVFYLLIRQIAAKPRYLNISLLVCGIVIAILGVVCLTEYLTTSAEMSVNVSLRYSKYAEAIATLFLLFAAFAVQKRNRNSMLFGAIALTAWLGIIFSLGRTQFIAGLGAVLAFAVISLINRGRGISLKKAVIFASLFILITVFSQISFTENSNQTTLKRLTSDENSQTSLQVRILLWQIAFESFKENPVLGAGAENFAANYETARKNYAENHPNDTNLALYEEILPERAHNEFLQILAELGIIGAAIFAWLLFGISRFVFSMRKQKTSPLQIAAVAGIFAFLVSSLASSYSFRVPANGLCFFFVLAVFVQSSKFKVLSSESNRSSNLQLETCNLRPIFAASVIICIAMLVFSAVRGVSLMNLQFALTSEEDAEKETYFQKAIAFDEQDALTKYYYGWQLYNSARASEAIEPMRFAVDKGIATSVAYFNLASAQIVAKQQDEAEKTLATGLKIYPRSVFLRTAYASLLEDGGKLAEAGKEYEKAAEINAEQARSWRLAFAEGMKGLTKAEARDKQFVKAMDLRPTDAVYALLDFQRQFRPNLVRR